MADARPIDFERDVEAVRSFLNERAAERLATVQPIVAEGDALVLVVDDGGRAGGWAVVHLAYREELGWEPDADTLRFRSGSAAYLEYMEVEESRRDRGLGGALLAAVGAEARARAKRQLWLHTSESNVGAHRFYERHGWRHARPVHPAWNEGKAMRVYEKSL